MGATDVANKDARVGMKVVDMDTALSMTKHRWFHWMLVTIGGFGFLATGFEFTLQAYILPFAKCDLQIDAASMGTITSLFLGGGLVSSLVWGISADALGRRKVLIFAMVAEGLGTVLVSWSPNLLMFIIVRTFCGFMCAAAATLLISYVGEFCSDKTRPRNICLLGFAWTLTWLVMPALAAIIIPLDFEFDAIFVTYKPWRFFIALVGSLNILSGLLIYFLLPESPKYLLARGQEEEALDILRYMYAKNTGKSPDSFEVTKIYTGSPDADNNVLTKDLKDEKSNQSFAILFLNMLSQMKRLLCPPLLWNTLLSSTVYVCGMFGYYGLGLWLPHIFNNFEGFYNAHPNETASFCEVQTQMRHNIADANNTIMEQYCFTEINLSLYTNTLILGASCFIGNCVAIYLASKIQARILTAIFNWTASLCAFGVYFVQSQTMVVILGAAFMGAVNSGISFHNASAINLFPTAVRGMGICLGFLFGRLSALLSSLVFGYLIETYCAIPVFLVAGIVMLGGCVSMLIPKSSQKAAE